MTVADLCDVAYALLLQDLERIVLADRQVAAVLIGAGAKDVELPSLFEARAAFDEALVAVVVPAEDADGQGEMRRLLGV